MYLKYLIRNSNTCALSAKNTKRISTSKHLIQNTTAHPWHPMYAAYGHRDVAYQPNRGVDRCAQCNDDVCCTGVLITFTHTYVCLIRYLWLITLWSGYFILSHITGKGKCTAALTRRIRIGPTARSERVT